jgi:ribonuclease P protein component
LWSDYPKVERRYRLTRSTDFKQVRRSGKPHAHSLIALYVVESPHLQTRIGIAAGRTIGNAVKRNRAKRLIRAAMQGMIPQLKQGVDILLIARTPAPTASQEQVRAALETLLRRAGLLVSSDEA